MKKIISLMLCFALVLSLAACAKEPTAEELYKLASEKSAAMDKIDSTITMTGSISVGSEGVTQDIDLDMSGSVKGENVGKEGMKMEMPMEIKMMGVTLETKMYFADGWYLMDMMGQKVKCPMDIEKAMEQFASVEVQPLDYITLGEMTKDDNTKLYTIPFTMDMDKALEMSSEALDMTGMDAEDMENITWEDASGTVVADKEGNIKSVSTTIAFSGSVEGADMSCEMTADVVYNEIGDGFAVNIPDVNEFEEVPAESLGLEAA